MTYLIPVLVYVLGLVVGSFLTALLWRLRTHESFVIARSYCPHCRKTLGVFDLVPLLSYLFLRGRCRFCEKSISWQYPVIEAVTGLLFLLIFLRYGVFARESAVTVEPRLYALLIRDWLAAAVCVAVFVFDARYFLIPRALVLPTALVALLLGLVGGVGIVSSLIAIVIAFGFFGLQFLMSRGRWIGFGDVVYGVFMGAVLGFPKVIVGLFLAYLAGAVYAVIMMATRKMKLKTEVPFGTFLASATVVTMIFGDSILNWYLGLL